MDNIETINNEIDRLIKENRELEKRNIELEERNRELEGDREFERNRNFNFLFGDTIL